MKRILLALSIIIILLASFVAPVFADEGKGLKVGDKVVIDNGVVAQYLGKNTDGTLNWQATIGAPQYLDDLVTPIDCSWSFDAQKTEFTTRANLYTATIKDTKVSVEYEKKHLSWNPDVYVGGKKLTPITTMGSLVINDPINENYFGNTLQWEYPNITRNLRIIEGMLIEYYTIASLPDGDITIKTNTNKDVDFIWTRPSEAWDADNNSLALQQVKDKEVVLTLEALKEATFPITIDPDTTFYTSSSDGMAYYQSLASYVAAHDNATGSTLNSGTSYDIGQYYSASVKWNIFRSFGFLDTEAIPDEADIDVAILSLYGRLNLSDTDFDITIQDGQPDYPHDPFVAGDYLYTHYTGDGGNVSTAGFTTAGYNDITLNATGRGWINKTGVTKLAFLSSRDISDTPPTGEERVWVWSYEKGDGYRPKLVVTYSASAAPTCSTQAASNEAKHSARLNSLLTDDGGGFCRSRFGYGTTAQATIALYDEQTDWTGYTYSSSEHPFEDVAGLGAGATYHFRVEMENDKGVTLGADMTFDTLAGIDDPTDFRGYPQSTSVSLSWTIGGGSSTSMVRFAFDDFPDATDAGTLVYSGTSASYTHDGELTPGTTYYYSVWGISGADESAGYDTVMVTTSAAETAGEGLPTPTTPARWLAAPDYTNLENLLVVYPAVNSVADYFEMPRETMWMMLALLGAAALGIAIYMVSGGKMLLGMLALTLVLVFGWAIKIVPFWIPLMTIILVVGIKVSHRETQY